MQAAVLVLAMLPRCWGEELTGWLEERGLGGWAEPLARHQIDGINGLQRLSRAELVFWWRPAADCTGGSTECARIAPWARC